MRMASPATSTVTQHDARHHMQHTQVRPAAHAHVQFAHSPFQLRPAVPLGVVGGWVVHGCLCRKVQAPPIESVNRRHMADRALPPAKHTSWGTPPARMGALAGKERSTSNPSTHLRTPPRQGPPSSSAARRRAELRARWLRWASRLRARNQLSTTRSKCLTANCASLRLREKPMAE